MKTVYALLLSFFLVATSAFAQQQPSNSLQDAKSATAPKAVKKAKSKKKSKKEQKEVAGENEQESLPPLLSERLKKLSQAVPADGGLSNPGGLAHQEFMHRAYPGTTIPAERIEAARDGHARMADRNFSEDTLSPWQTFGPSYALYPSLRSATSNLTFPTPTRRLAVPRLWRSPRIAKWTGARYG